MREISGRIEGRFSCTVCGCFDDRRMVVTNQELNEMVGEDKHIAPCSECGSDKVALLGFCVLGENDAVLLAARVDFDLDRWIRVPVMTPELS